ncbi:MAG: MFS transporter [Dehalococcoidia bacterium]|nr:MFS transporter [Dehalococcoidia bacterium]
MKRLLSRAASSLPPGLGLVLLFAVAHFSHHLVTALPVPLLPFIRDEFSLDYTRAALVVSAFSVPYGFAQLPSGWLADKVGPRPLLFVSTSGVAFAGLLVGVSTQYMLLLAFLVLMGTLGGGYHPSAPSVISGVIAPSHRGRALGFHMIGGSASYFVAPLIAAAVATAWGWRSSFIVLSLPAIAFGFLFADVLKRRARREVVQTSSAPPVPGSDETSVGWLRLAMFLVLSCFTAGVVVSCISFIPLYLVDMYGQGEDIAAVAVSVFYSTGLWAGVVGGLVSDKVGRVPVVAAMALLSGPALMLLSLGVSVSLIMGLLVLLGMALYARAPATEAYVVAHTTPRKRSTVLGLYYFGGIEGSGVLAPVVGFLIDRFGFSFAFAASGMALLCVAAICSLVLLRLSRSTGATVA